MAGSEVLYTPGVEADVSAGLYGGMGNINMTTDRSQEASVPWAGNPGPMLRKLTHFRAPGLGDAMWSGSCIYDIPGVSPSVSEYESHDPYGDIPDHLDYQVRSGVVTNKSLRDPAEPTLTRDSRVAAHFDSLPASAFFQGFANLHWSGMMAGYRPQIQPRPLTQNFNPNQMGSKELHKATQYKPVPPMGSIVSYYGTDKAV